MTKGETMDTDAFRIEEDAARHYATVRFVRGGSGNKVSAQEIPLIGRAIRTLGSRKDVKAVLVRGEGAHFCQGRAPDAPGKAPTTALGIREGITEPILGVYEDVRMTPVPVIAVVQGEAKGFGCALVSGCDLAIAAEDAMFSFPELDHHLPPTLAMSAMLHKVTPKRLLHLIYTRRTIGAAEALSLGLISEVAKKGELDKAVEATLSLLVDRRREALIGVKEYMNAALYMDPAGASRLAGNLLACVLSSPKD
jgi:enoyl-CoA hydratase/carnithine racemase